MEKNAKTNSSISRKNLTKHGFLLVITGPAASGKDSVIDLFLEHEISSILNIKRLVTHAAREPREGKEINGHHYFFTTEAELFSMYDNNQLIEKPVVTGSTYKGTSRSQIKRVIDGENLVWRINPSLASSVASGKFFDNIFPEHSESLKKSTLVVCITAPQIVLNKRRSKDRPEISATEYTSRDKQESRYFKVLQKKSILIENHEGRLNETVEHLVKIISSHTSVLKSI